MKRIWRSSSSLRSSSSGAMTTNFARSKAMCRSIKGSVPLPIEPKPSMTIGPSKRACSGPPPLPLAFISQLPSGGARRARQRPYVIVGEPRHQHRRIGLRRRAAGRTDEAARAVERAAREFAGEQPVPLVRSGQPQIAGLLSREAEARIIRSIADQQDGCVALGGRCGEGTAHQRSADAGPTAVPRNRQGPEQQRRAARTGGYVPQAHRAHDLAIAAGDERQPPCRQAILAQPLGGFGEARRAESLVEQRLAGDNVAFGLRSNDDHGSTSRALFSLVERTSAAALRCDRSSTAQSR